jgi:hypothetical protein
MGRFMLHVFYPHKKQFQYMLKRKMNGRQSWFGHGGKRKIPSLLRIKSIISPATSENQTHNQSFY